jgi:hypothetical protein
MNGAARWYYRSPRRSNETFEGQPDRRNRAELLEVWYKHGPSLNIPTFFQVIHQSSIRGWQKLVLGELNRHYWGYTCMWYFIYKVQFFDRDLIDLVHDIYAACVDTIACSKRNRNGIQPSRTSIKSSTYLISGL